MYEDINKVSPEIAEVIKNESTHWQPKKQALIVSMMLILFII